MSDARAQLMRSAGLEAGALLKEYFYSSVEIRKKGELDLVTMADEKAERLIVDAVVQAFPDDAIIAEEGSSKDGSSGYSWIIDPLDGTTNFAHRFPHFSVSIAVAKAGRVIHGLVYDPMKNERFEAHAGEGTTLNDQPISVGTREVLGEALAVTGFSYDRRERMDFLLERVRLLLNNCQGLRRLGSAALDLAYVASGRFDVFIEDGLNAWDMAAGQLLVTEAGGRVSLLNGETYDLNGGQVLATNSHLQALALKTLVH